MAAKGKLIAIIGGAVGALILLIIADLRGAQPRRRRQSRGRRRDYLRPTATATPRSRASCPRRTTGRPCSARATTAARSRTRIAEDFEDQGIPGYEDYEDLLDDIDYEFEIGDVSEKETTATVEYTYSIEYTGDEEDFDIFNQEDVEAELELVKEDGDWKVDSDSGDF